jgi:hypothetical protein
VALQGTLETFALPDVLRLLASTKKTGAYRLDGDRGTGCLWVKEGGIVGGAFAGAAMTDTVEAAFELLRFSDGEFVFEDGAESDDPNDVIDVEDLLSKAEAMLEEWKELEAVVPSLDHGITLNPVLPGDEVTIKADTWIFLTVIGAGTTVGRLGKKLALGELGVSRAVKEMVELGVVELSEPGTVTAPAPEPEPEPVAEVDTFDAGESFSSFETESTFDDEYDDTGAFEVPDAEFDGDTSFLDAPLIAEPEVVAAAEPVAEEVEFEPFDPNALVIEDDGDLAEPDTEIVFEPVEEIFEPADEPEPLPETEATPVMDTASSDPTDAAEIARQLANLSPKAAKAVAAAAKATTQEEREAALAEVDESEDPINRELLLKFLGSVNS